jgi:hypothetical protein
MDDVMIVSTGSAVVRQTLAAGQIHAPARSRLAPGLRLSTSLYAIHHDFEIVIVTG